LNPARLTAGDFGSVLAVAIEDRTATAAGNSGNLV
jgi:hypothetical protein